MAISSVGGLRAVERSRGLPFAGEVMRWLFTGKGILTLKLARSGRP
jgi:hypothetical protein